MTDLRSSATFRSNIYPTSTNGALINDRRFLNAISDPEALDILWRYNGSQGAKLNNLQKRQHEMAMHCAYAEEGDFPWGTPVGSNSVVCLCEKVDCPRYKIECSNFHPEGFVSQPADRESVPRVVAKKDSVQKAYPVVEKHTPQKTRHMRVKSASNDKPKQPTAPIAARKPSSIQRSNFSFVSAATVERRSLQGLSSRKKKPQLGPWTRKEDSILHEMYPLYGISVRKWTKKLPGRSVEEILDRAHELKVRYVPKRERDSGRTKPKPKNQKPVGMSKAEKKRRREQMRKKPWEPNEDMILRKNYPIYGAEMKDWPQKLMYRTKTAIETRARQLGL